jgi:hypothetical protein
MLYINKLIIIRISYDLYPYSTISYCHIHADLTN